MSLDCPKTTAGSAKKQAFSSSEKELLITLVREHPIIEDKRTNAKNIELKKQAWKELTTEFNSQPYISQRTGVQLKRCWENIKSLRKKELSHEAAYIRGTSGGPPESGVSDNIVDIICPYINLKVPGVIDSNTLETVNGGIQDYAGPSTPKRKRRLGDNEADEVGPKTKRVHIIQDDVVGDQDTTAFIQLNNENCKTPNNNKYNHEIAARIKRCHKNIQQDQLLHDARMKRENILFERERSTYEFEKQIQQLQIDKLKLEIEILKNKAVN